MGATKRHWLAAVLALILTLALPQLPMMRPMEMSESGMVFMLAFLCMSELLKE